MKTAQTFQKTELRKGDVHMQENEIGPLRQ
jgi:hypothetical protein